MKREIAGSGLETVVLSHEQDLERRRRSSCRRRCRGGAAFPDLVSSMAAAADLDAECRDNPAAPQIFNEEDDLLDDDDDDESFNHYDDDSTSSALSPSIAFPRPSPPRRSPSLGLPDPHHPQLIQPEIAVAAES